VARKKRIWLPDYFYHIISRGNRRDALFKDDSDFNVFLHILKSVNEKSPFELASYCLMTNHFHLQMRSTEQSISKVMSLINKRYADYYNAKNGISGHVFEKRFFDRIINTDEDMMEVSRYIHLNPLDAGIVRHAHSYPWSSYRYYLTSQRNNLLNRHSILDYFKGEVIEKQRQYKQFVEEADAKTPREVPVTP